MIIDFHTHCYKDELAPKAISKAASSPQLGLGPFFDGTVAGLKASMAAAGVNYSVVLNIANRPETTTRVNDWAIALNNEESVISFGSVHPSFKDYKDELKRLKENGIKGLKIHPHYQGFLVNDKAAYPLYEAAAEAGFIMLFHCGVDSMIHHDYTTPALFDAVIKDFSGAKIVAAHLGGWTNWEDCLRYIIGRDIYIDTSFSLPFLTEKQRTELFSSHDNNKILFGTDTPWADQKKGVEIAGELLTDKALYNKIMHQNAAKLLGI